jgi:glycosyltransferase involved in cell wall biosynthesis
MNVVHVFPYTPTISGGHSNAIRGFISCQLAKGINAVGIAPKASNLSVEQDWGFPLVEVDSLWELRWKTIAEQFGLKAGDSLLNFYSIHYRFTPFLKDLRHAGVPYVLNEQGQLAFQNVARWLKKFIYLNCLDWGPRRAAGLHVLTRKVAEGLKYLVPGYRGRVLVQGNLISLPGPEQMAAAARSTYGIPEKSFVLLYLGRLDIPVKGLDCVVEAFSQLPSERFHLIMAGPDWNGGQAKLENLAKRLGCLSRLHFPGPLFGDKKWALLRMADVFVSPSRKEGFSLSHAEALCCGLPLLTSTKINLAPQLREADAAFLVPPAARPLAEAMKKLEAEPQLRANLGRCGQAWFQANCDPDRAGELFREFYQGILENPHKC